MGEDQFVGLLLAKYRFWSGEAIPGVRRPVFIRVRTAYSIAAT